jgi:transcriptional regulator with XRE-family HTH domain
MERPRTYSRATREAVRLLGAEIRLARKEHHWTVAELAERVGVSERTMRNIERGDPSVGLGIAFEAAVLAGVDLFGPDPIRRRIEAARVQDRLAVLPTSIRRPREHNDAF